MRTVALLLILGSLVPAVSKAGETSPCPRTPAPARPRAQVAAHPRAVLTSAPAGLGGPGAAGLGGSFVGEEGEDELLDDDHRAGVLLDPSPLPERRPGRGVSAASARGNPFLASRLSIPLRC